MALLRRLADLALVIVVQSFMLLQVGVFYVLLHFRSHNLRRVLPWVATTASSPAPATTSSVSLLPRTVSVIIPVYNEARVVGRCLRALAVGAIERERLEIIIVDGGCNDATMEAVSEAAAELSLTLHTASARGGRGPSIVAGVAVATGDAVLTLHADTTLPAGWDGAILAALANPSVAMTAFSFGTDRAQLAHPEAPPAGLSLMEWTVNCRSRWFELPFGDQALAIRRTLLDEVGGFPPVPILEEYLLVNTLRARCAAGRGRILTLDAPALCSPRRWERSKIWRINAVNQAVMLWHRWGATPEQIFEFYYGMPVTR